MDLNGDLNEIEKSYGIRLMFYFSDRSIATILWS
jgi:hypothetical protein